MKRIIAALLALCLLLSFCGCVAEDREYVPHGGGLAEDHDDEVISEDEVIQELTLTYYPNRSMNPYQCSDFTNRALFSLMYQGLFAVDRDYQVVPIKFDTSVNYLICIYRNFYVKINIKFGRIYFVVNLKDTLIM